MGILIGMLFIIFAGVRFRLRRGALEVGSLKKIRVNPYRKTPPNAPSNRYLNDTHMISYDRKLSAGGGCITRFEVKDHSCFWR